MSGSSNYGTSLFSSNAYVRNSNNAFIFSNTQPALGASGIAFNMPVWNSAGIFVNSAPSTAGATFTPNWIMTFLPNAVGIGTTSPSTKLHVNGDTRVGNTMIGSTYMRINQYGTGNRDAYVDLSGDDTYSLYGLRLGRYSSGISQIAHNGTGDFEFRSNNSAYIRFYVGTTKKFEMGTNTLINSNLSVGGYITSIGITNTGVISTYGTTGTSYSSVSAGSMVLKDDNPKIELYDMDTDGYTVLNKRIIAKNNNFYIENGSVSTTLLTITNTGRVGIGTTTPSYPLDIGTTVGAAFSYGYLNGSGNVGYITGGATNYYSIRTAGRITCPEFNANSDARIKQEVYYSDGESNLSLINNLKVAEFRFIDQVQNGSGKKQGFIAQDVEKVLPQAVSLTKDFIPDIYEGATDLQLLPAGKLKIYLKSIGKISVGDTLKMIVPSGDMIRTVETIQADGSFVVGDVKEAPVFLFVYGKLVNDFRSIDYNRLFTAGIGAIQELDRKRDIQQSEIEKVIEENSHLKAEIQSLRTEIEQIKAILLSGNR
jgi:hypothetical protein